MSREQETMQKKVKDLLSKKRSGNNDILERIEKDNSLLQDYIIPLHEKSPIVFSANGEVKIAFNDKEFSLHENALCQLADKFDIPRKYIKYLNSTDWGRQLLQNVLTEHKLNIDRDRVLFRTVGDQVRAVLSDRYRRLNSDEIFRSFILGSKSQGAEIYDAYYSETKSYISTIIPTVYPIETPNNGILYSIFGARITNSDFGDGALNIRAFQMNVFCINQMVSESLLKQIHLGKRLPDNISFSDKTYELDTQAMASAVDDIMQIVLSEDRILKSAQSIINASSKIIDISKEILTLPQMGMSKDEVEMISDKLITNDPENGLEGKPTLWKLSQAITSVSNDIGEGRKQELDELAGKLISL